MTNHPTPVADDARGALNLRDALRKQAALARELLAVGAGRDEDPPSGALDISDEDRRANEDRAVQLAELVVALDDRLAASARLRRHIMVVEDTVDLAAGLDAGAAPGPALQRWTIEMGAVAGLGDDCAFDVLIANLPGPETMLELLVSRGAPGGATSEVVGLHAARALSAS